MKKQIVWVLCGFVLLGLGFFLGQGWNGQKQSDAVQKQAITTPQPVLAVEAIVPSIEQVESVVTASGNIVAKETAEVGAKLTGVAVGKVLVEVGDVVKAGQVLAYLDNSMALQSVEVAKAQLVSALANQEKASADLARIKPLIEIDAISRQQYDAYQTAKAQADASVLSAKAHLNNANIQNQNSAIIAPVSGLISHKTAQVGLIATGTPLFTIVKDGVLEWQANVSTKQAEQIHIGQLAQLQVGDEQIQAVVSKIAPIANNNKELTIHATLAPNPLLKSGMYQLGKFVLSTQALPALPARVVTINDGFSYVWVLRLQGDDKATAHRQKVEVLGRTKDKVAIDIKPDVLVIKEGGNFLSEGDLVKVVNLADIKKGD